MDDGKIVSVDGGWRRTSEFVAKVRQNWLIWSCARCGFEATRGWEHTRDGKKPEWQFCPHCGKSFSY